MFRKNAQHLQQHLYSDLNGLSEKQRARLDESWAGTFYRQFFCRLDETAFSVLYSDEASRPNIPVNVLVGLEALKSGFGWSDAEMYDAFIFDLQVRYALGYRNLGDGEFELRTTYNFRQRLSEHMQTTGVNLLDQAFAKITDEQIRSFQLKTGRLRMDSTQIASNIRQMTRLQLLVEVLQRVQRMLTEAEQAAYGEVFAPYLQGSSGQYVYHLKGEDTGARFQQIGDLMLRLLTELASTYADHPVYQMLQRVFAEQFTLTESAVQAKPGSEISASSLRSPDDPEASYRRKGQCEYQGYVANVTETCDADNPFQLVVQVQTAPNTTQDATLLVEALPQLKARTGVHVLYNDAAYCGPLVDPVLREHQVEQVPTAFVGKPPNPNKLSLTDFQVETSPTGQPQHITCPNGQSVPAETGRTAAHWLAHFMRSHCEGCALQTSCPTRVRKRDLQRTLRFSTGQADVAVRRRRSAAYHRDGINYRVAIEAAIGAIKRPFSNDQLPVRGQFRVGTMMFAAAVMLNIRRIQRFLATAARTEPSASSNGNLNRRLASFLSALAARFHRCLSPVNSLRTAASLKC